MFWWEHVNTRKHVSEHSWLSGWVILSILAHLAHLAQSYISRINSATNTCKCSWFDLTSRKICSDWKQKLGEKWPMLTTFFLTATAAITDSDLYQIGHGHAHSMDNSRQISQIENIVELGRSRRKVVWYTSEKRQNGLTVLNLHCIEQVRWSY